MAVAIPVSALMILVVTAFVAWRRYLWVAKKVRDGQADTCPYSLTDVFGDRHLVNARSAA